MRPSLDSEPKRLLLLGSEFPPGPGGIGTHAYQLALQLSRRGWDVLVLTPQAYVTDDVRAAFNDTQPFTVMTLADRGSGLSAMQQRLSTISGAAKTFRPDVMIASGLRALWTAAALQLRYPVPWVAIGHGSEFLGQSGLPRFLTEQAIRRATAVVAVSEYTADLIRSAVTPARLVIIPNGADGERFHPAPADPALRDELGLQGKRVLLTVGHVSERKAQDIVIRALPAVVAQHPDVVYVMAGLPSRREELQQLADQLGVGDSVRFAGSVSDRRLVDYYNLSDLFVLVSRRAAGGDVEGYGIVVKEAALCGKPAVVSQGCGLTEAIEEGVTGISVPPEDAGATAEAIAGLLADESRRLTMGREARRQALQATWDQRMVQYDDLLEELVSPVATSDWAANGQQPRQVS